MFISTTPSTMIIAEGNILIDTLDIKNIKREGPNLLLAMVNPKRNITIQYKQQGSLISDYKKMLRQIARRPLKTNNELVKIHTDYIV